RQYDYLLIDTAAGISASVLHFVASAQTALVVITPEPTSLTDAFSLLKVLHQKGYRRTVQVVVNMVGDSRQAWRIFERFNAAVEKYLGLSSEWLACIPRDEAMRRAVMMQKPTLLSAPGQPASTAFMALAELLAQQFQENTVSKAVFSRDWQRLFARTGRRMAARAQVEQAALSAPAESARVEQAPSAGEASFDAHWSRLQRELSALFTWQDVLPEQSLQLFKELLQVAGNRLGSSRAELVYELLRQMESYDFSPEQRQHLENEWHRLGQRGARTVPGSAQSVAAPIQAPA